MFGNTNAFLSNLTQLKNDFTPTFEVRNTNYMVSSWYDYAVIKLSILFESLPSIGLIRKADIFLCLYVNTGINNVSVFLIQQHLVILLQLLIMVLLELVLSPLIILQKRAHLVEYCYNG